VAAVEEEEAAAGEEEVEVEAEGPTARTAPTWQSLARP